MLHGEVLQGPLLCVSGSRGPALLAPADTLIQLADAAGNRHFIRKTPDFFKLTPRLYLGRAHNVVLHEADVGRARGLWEGGGLWEDWGAEQPDTVRQKAHLRSYSADLQSQERRVT